MPYRFEQGRFLGKTPVMRRADQQVGPALVASGAEQIDDIALAVHHCDHPGVGQTGRQPADVAPASQPALRLLVRLTVRCLERGARKAQRHAVSVDCKGRVPVQARRPGRPSGLRDHAETLAGPCVATFSSLPSWIAKDCLNKSVLAQLVSW